MKITDKIKQFRDERNWRASDNDKDLALSITLEAAELLEIYQWRSPEEAKSQEYEHLKEEIADVLIYTIALADSLGMDIDMIIEEKLAKNAMKYPAIKNDFD